MGGRDKTYKQLFHAKKSFEFPSEEALKQYLNEHPKADKSLHYVKKQETSLPDKYSPPAPTPTKEKFTPTTPNITSKDAIMDHLRKNLDKWSNTLDSSERGIIRKYSGSYYSVINWKLRDTSGTASTHKDFTLDTEIETLDAALRRNTTTDSIVTWRGSSLSYMKEAIYQILEERVSPTDIVLEDPGFTSTSINPEIAAGFTPLDDAVMFRIVLPKETQGAYLASGLSDNHHEKEFLLPKGSKFRYTKVTRVSADQEDEYSLGRDHILVDCELINNYGKKVEVSKFVAMIRDWESASKGSFTGGRPWSEIEWMEDLEDSHPDLYKKFEDLGSESKSISGEEEEKLNELLDIKTSKDMVTWRRDSNKELAKMLESIVSEGMHPKDAVFTEKSLSQNYDSLKRAMGSRELGYANRDLDYEIKYKVTIPKGTKGGSNKSGFVLPLGTKFQIQKVSQSIPGHFFVECEVLPEDSKS